MTEIMTVEQLAAKLQNLSDDMLPAIQKAMTDAVQNVEAKAKENCTPGSSPYWKAPHITGTLRRSINSETRTEDNEIHGIVGANTKYAAAVHEGTSKMAPRPFILDAIKSEENTTIEILSDGIAEVLDVHTI